MRLASLTLILFAVACTTHAQHIQRVQSFGTPRNDFFRAMIQTADGGAIVLGSIPVQKTGANYTEALWIVRFDIDDRTVWGKNFNDVDGAVDATALGDSGIGLAGYTYQNTNGKRMTKADACVMSFDMVAALRWSVVLRGSDVDIAAGVAATSSGDIIAGGTTRSFDGDMARDTTNGTDDGWLARFAPDGTRRWITFVEGSGSDIINRVAVASDGSIYFAGSTTSPELPKYRGGVDLWMGKLSPDGVLLWQQCLGGSADDSGTAVIMNGDSSILLTGATRSNDGDVSGAVNGSTDIWVIAADSAGSVSWQRTLGTRYIDIANSISIDHARGYLLVSATTDSGSTVVSSTDSLFDIMSYFLDRNGNILGNTSIVGNNHDVIYRLEAKRGSDGYRAAGYTRSLDGYFAAPYGLANGWVASIAAFSAATSPESAMNDVVIVSSAMATSINGCFRQPATIVVHDLVGRELLRRFASECQNVVIPHHVLANGQYMVTVMYGDRVVKSAMILVARR